MSAFLLRAAAVALIGVLHPVDAATASESRRDLQQQQLQDTLDLNLQQSAPRARADLSTTDRLRLEQLQLRHRMDQQQLEQHQLQHERAHRNRYPRDAHLQQRLFAQQRQLQLQRFDLEQRELMRSIPPRLLQRPVPGGRLQP